MHITVPLPSYWLHAQDFSSSYQAKDLQAQISILVVYYKYEL